MVKSSFCALLGLSILCNAVRGDSEHNHDHDEDHDEEASLLATFDVATPVESVEYDSVNEAYYYASVLTGELFRLEGSSLSAIEDGTAEITSPFDMGNYTLYFPTGMYTDGETLYINNYFSGQIILVDVGSTMKAFDAFWVFYDEATFTIANVNGMCNDPSNTDYIYVTDAGINTTTFTSNTVRGNIYRVSLADGSYEKMYDGSSSIYPNGCVINSDGILYAVESRFTGTAQLIVWDMSGDTWNFYDTPTRGDGIAFSSDGDLFYTTSAVDGNGTDGGVYMCSASSIASGDYSFELVIDGLVSPADMSYNGDDSVLAIPTLDSTTLTNAIYFVQIDGGSSDSALRNCFGNGLSYLLMLVLTATVYSSL